MVGFQKFLVVHFSCAYRALRTELQMIPAYSLLENSEDAFHGGVIIREKRNARPEDSHIMLVPYKKGSATLCVQTIESFLKSLANHSLMSLASVLKPSRITSIITKMPAARDQMPNK